MDRWLHAQGIESGDEYLVRTIEPRCIVALADPASAPTHSAEGIVTDRGEAFYVAAWLSAMPGAATRAAILREAAAANEAFTLDSQADDE